MHQDSRATLKYIEPRYGAPVVGSIYGKYYVCTMLLLLRKRVETCAISPAISTREVHLQKSATHDECRIGKDRYT